MDWWSKYYASKNIIIVKKNRNLNDEQTNGSNQFDLLTEEELNDDEPKNLEKSETIHKFKRKMKKFKKNCNSLNKKLFNK